MADDGWVNGVGSAHLQLPGSFWPIAVQVIQVLSFNLGIGLFV